MFSKSPTDLTCLESKLTGGDQEEGLDFRLVDVELLECGDDESSGLACTVLGTSEDVALSECDGDGFFLNGRRAFETSFKNAHEEFAFEVHVLELCALCRSYVLCFWSGDLGLFLQEECGVPNLAALAYLPDGSRLTDDNIRELAGSQDDTIFVFNKFYLDNDLQQVLADLHIEPLLQPPTEDTISSTPPFRASQLAAAYQHTALAHLETVTRTASSILRQHEALGVASRSLDLNVLSMSDAFDGFEHGARAELEKQSMLLGSLSTDLQLVKGVRIHPEFMSPTFRRAVETGGKERTLGDYVSDVKIRQVADGCSKIHDGLSERFRQAQEAMRRLTEGSDRVREMLRSSRSFDDAESCKRRAEDAADRIANITANLEKLKQSDAQLRREVENITVIKVLLNHSDFYVITALQGDFRAKTSFTHIQRLHSMPFAYGATLIEIVRRKEFSRFFYQRAQVILEVMAKLTTAEKKRRQIYRGDVHGQLPFETKGMNDSVPSIDFSPSGGKDNEYSLERTDVERFMHELEDIYHEIPQDEGSQSLMETKGALEKLLARMDSLESSFDRIVERSLLSASRLSQSRRRIVEIDDSALQELANHNSVLRREKSDQENVFAREREQLGEARSDVAELQRERERVASLEQDRESDLQARKLLADLQSLRKDKAKDLSRTRKEFEEVKQMEGNHSNDQTVTLRNLEEARLRGDDLESQIKAAREENGNMGVALKEIAQQKDKLLKDQALEHDRLLRDHIAEADGDRAILEQQFFERQLKETRAEIDILHADIAGLREEQQRTEHELGETKHAERSDFEQILDVAIALHDSSTKAVAVLQPLSVHPGATARAGNSLADSVLFTPPLRLPTVPPGDEPSTLDPSDPAGALELLRAFDLDTYSETVAKVASVIRKWQKQCKEYRERSKGKISFRNFAKGDLALFLPTRNSVSKPWAAFNVSFPHYFLQATGRLAEQLKTREWIVARITSITERVVDHKDPESNPYGLGDGVKYFLLEVEDWTRPGVDTKRKKSTTKPGQDPSSPPSLERPISPPPAEPSPSGASAAEPLGATRSPTSHLFPVRTRSNSATAGPSSLSRLLAQAPVESPLETIPPTPPVRSRTPSPTSKLPPIAPPSPTRLAALAHSPSVSSPLRPGSRASGSTSSRISFSGGRIAPFPRSSVSGSPGVSKAAPTTALSSEAPVSPPASSTIPPARKDNQSSERLPSLRSSTPSPTHSATDGMSNVLLGRRRVASEHVNSSSGLRSRAIATNGSSGTTATSALANLASSWVRGRRKKNADEDSTSVIDARAQEASSDEGASSSRRHSITPASELLKKF
ncbi:hypothetical protein SCHPADRAFT_914912 [Schizopora paradoxa]|uniref:Autophagy-related protein 11 n=1 Tax=Schizopora paradoxa TaxID=27342 RepID=A0A0H2RR42_9AGAM|nr:hypothetical protein SCHPADRAFT_914912 [Schizopora paradoxa]